MTRYNFTGFYGSYGHILVNDDGSAFVEIIWNGCLPCEPFRKTYRTERGAKIALSRFLDSYRITDTYRTEGER